MAVKTDARKDWVKTGKISTGNTVRVYQKIQEGGKTRLQPFEGLVIATRHGTEPGATFTVRRVTSGIGMEKIFPLYSPIIDHIEVTRTADVRRSKLYYIRDKSAKAIRRKLKFTGSVKESLMGEAGEVEKEKTKEDDKEDHSGEDSVPEEK